MGGPVKINSIFQIFIIYHDILYISCYNYNKYPEEMFSVGPEHPLTMGLNARGIL